MIRNTNTIYATSYPCACIDLFQVAELSSKHSTRRYQQPILDHPKATLVSQAARKLSNTRSSLLRTTGPTLACPNPYSTAMDTMNEKSQSTPKEERRQSTSRHLNLTRLPTLQETLDRRTRPPLDLFCFYVCHLLQEYYSELQGVSALMVDFPTEGISGGCS